MSLKLIRKKNQELIVETGVIASDYFSRLKGLMGKKSYSFGEGMLFPKCNSIHMWGMKISIDVVFLKKENADWKIEALHSSLQPWKILPVTCLQAQDTLELPEGTIKRLGLERGEVLCTV